MLKLLLPVALIAVAFGLGLEAWSRVAPALDDGWLGVGMASRVFLPLVLLVVIAVGLWRHD